MAIDGLKEKVVRGGFAKACAQAINLILRVGSLMVLARLLEPRDFGLVGMVTAVTGVLGLFKDFGLSAATVQRKSITDEQISALFWINVLVGVILMFLSIAAAPFLAAFYHEPRLFWVTVILGTGFLFNAAGVQQWALLERQMRFVTLSVIDIVALSSGIAAAIVMAAVGWGYWALVGQAVIWPAVSTFCAWMISGWVPGMWRRGIGLRPLMRFGGTVTLNGLVVYVAYNLEKVLLGRYWGAAALGTYGRAYQLINIPTDNLNSAVGGVAFSALSRVQNEPERLRSYFLKGYSLVLALTLPVTIACALFADDLIMVLLGQKWQDAIAIFRLLAPTILVFALINPFSWLLFSLGLVGRSLKIALAIAPLTITAYFIGLPYGPTGVACAYSVAMTLWVVPHIAWCIHRTVVSPRDILQSIGRPLVSGIVAAGVSFGVKYYFGPSLPPLVRLVSGGSVLAVVYIWMLMYVMGQKAFYLDILRGLKRPSQTETDLAGRP